MRLSDCASTAVAYRQSGHDMYPLKRGDNRFLFVRRVATLQRASRVWATSDPNITGQENFRFAPDLDAKSPERLRHWNLKRLNIFNDSRRREAFLVRSEHDRSIEAMGYQLSSDTDGYRYQTNWRNVRPLNNSGHDVQSKLCSWTKSMPSRGKPTGKALRPIGAVTLTR